MRTLALIAPLLLTTAACQSEGDTGKRGWVHSSCVDLDKDGIKNRLDKLTSSDTDVVDVNGHCFQNTSTILTGEIYSIRFTPVMDDPLATPPLHIQMYWIPSEQRGTIPVWAPTQLSKAQCLDVPAGSFCAHVDDNTKDNASDDVDLRAMTGSLEITDVKTESNGGMRYKGNLAIAVWAIDYSTSPESTATPSLLLEGEFNWAPGIAEDED
jgi:hypothetical protein